MKLEAGNGNEIALAVLRSRKEEVEPEQAPEPPPPLKSWMEHGNAYASPQALRANYAEKSRVVEERTDISDNNKKQLHALLRMEQITAEAHAAGQDLGKITHRVDGKGVVFFTLESGGSIRDTGKELFFSSYDTQAQHIAALYASKKWGKHLAIEKGRIAFQPDRQREGWIPEPELSKRQQGLSR